MTMLDDVEFQIARLSLGVDDVLAVRVKGPITSVVASTLRAQLERQVGHKVLVLDSSIELSVLSKADVKKIAGGK